jgi:hypothetical protein
MPRSGKNTSPGGLNVDPVLTSAGVAQSSRPDLLLIPVTGSCSAVRRPRPPGGAAGAASSPAPPQNTECIKTGKDFMFSHGYIKHDFDVDEWARPEFLEKAAEEVLKEEWARRSWSKLPAGGGLEVEGTRLG